MSTQSTADTRIVYGARCSWWDGINQAAATPTGLPCCPYCGGVLFENDAAEWYRGIREHQDAGNSGYVAFLDWLRGKCFPTLAEARKAYDKRGRSPHSRPTPEEAD